MHTRFIILLIVLLYVMWLFYGSYKYQWKISIKIKKRALKISKIFKKKIIFYHWKFRLHLCCQHNTGADSGQASSSSSSMGDRANDVTVDFSLLVVVHCRLRAKQGGKTVWRKRSCWLSVSARVVFYSRSLLAVKFLFFSCCFDDEVSNINHRLRRRSTVGPSTLQRFPRRLNDMNRRRILNWQASYID